MAVASFFVDVALSALWATTVPERAIWNRDRQRFRTNNRSRAFDMVKSTLRRIATLQLVNLTCNATNSNSFVRGRRGVGGDENGNKMFYDVYVIFCRLWIWNFANEKHKIYYALCSILLFHGVLNKIMGLASSSVAPACSLPPSLAWSAEQTNFSETPNTRAKLIKSILDIFTSSRWEV